VLHDFPREVQLTWRMECRHSISHRGRAEQAMVRRDNEAIPAQYCRHFLRSLVFSRSTIYCDDSPTKRTTQASGIGNAYIPRSLKRTDRC
jgi:hypothetical protein